MKINIREKASSRVSLGDLIVGGSGTEYLVSKNSNNEYTLYDIRLCNFVGFGYASINDLLENFFSEYTHYPKETLELVVDGGKQ